MRDEMNKSVISFRFDPVRAPGLSILYDNPLALATDEKPFSMMGAERRFPGGAYGHPDKLAQIVQKLFNDEVEAISTYERSIEQVTDANIAYIFGVIADEERNHRKILQEIQASIIGYKFTEADIAKPPPFVKQSQ